MYHAIITNQEGKVMHRAKSANLSGLLKICSEWTRGVGGHGWSVNVTWEARGV